jgi:tRNA-specific 2-thiouridylase
MRAAFPTHLWPERITAQVRARHQPQPARWRLVDDSIEVTFDDAVLGVALGQALVAYDGDVVLGGGVIVERVDGLHPRRH